VKSVGRYLAPLGDGRQIEKDEYDDLTAHGITVWFVREGAANSLLDGHALGVSHANSAVANLARLGLKDQVVYAAADFDVQPSQYAACDDYMRGFASVIGLERTGIYAGMRYINHCRDTLAKWYWQAGATSWDHGETGMVHIQQTTKAPPLPGTDHNYIYTDSHGQVGSADADTKQGDSDMKYIWSAGRGGALVGETGYYPEGPYADVALATFGGITLNDAQFDMARQDAINRGEMFAAMVAKASGTVSIDYDALGKAIAASLPAGGTVTAADIAKALEPLLGVAVKPA
jgi:hypothetical protein